jgi:hypothetical protein
LRGPACTPPEQRGRRRAGASTDVGAIALSSIQPQARQRGRLLRRDARAEELERQNHHDPSADQLTDELAGLLDPDPDLDPDRDPGSWPRDSTADAAASRTPARRRSRRPSGNEVVPGLLAPELVALRRPMRPASGRHEDAVAVRQLVAFPAAS